MSNHDVIGSDTFDREGLNDLLNTVSPSGYEEEAVKEWKKQVEEFADRISVDVHGNCIAQIDGETKLRVLLAGHLDQVGIMVTDVDDDGFISFAFVGGVDNMIYPGQRVILKRRSGGEKIGFIGRKATHVLGDDQYKIPKDHELWIDMGDKEYVKEHVKPGDIGIIKNEVHVNGDKIISAAIDDKGGAYVISEVIRQLRCLSNLGKTKRPQVIGAATCQEEMGFMGAYTVSYAMNPDIGIAIDVTHANDFPAAKDDKKKHGKIELGKGPVIGWGSCLTKKLSELMIKVAEENDIPYQIGPDPYRTGTDATALALTRGGVATGLISIPLRYMHTPVEMADLNDLENATKLLTKLMFHIESKEQFIPC